MSTIVIERQTPSSTRLRFVWKGGPYIDVFWAGGEVPNNVTADPAEERAPFTAINVYDYAAGKPTISTEQEVAGKADEWIQDYAQDYELG